MKLFVNREPELNLIDESFNALLVREQRFLRTPIIEVQGMGGIGKTSLLRECESYLDTLDNPIKPIEVCNFIFEWTRGYPLAMNVLAQAAQNGLDPRTPERQQATTLDQSPTTDHIHIEDDLSVRSPINSPSTLEQASLRLNFELPHADILLVTVTKIETMAVLRAFSKNCMHEAQRYFIGNKTYYELGVMNGARVFLMQCEMGTSGPGSSLLTVYKAIQTLNPSSIIMTGIAYGVDPTKQRIGDVLVSKQLCDYGFQRVSTTKDGTLTIIPRGDRVTASVKLLDRFRTGSLNWMKRHIHFGTILSGEKLIDNINFREQLLALEPEAIGGEMEGVGLYTAAQDEKVDWILVKAISDFADGKKASDKMVAISTKDRDQKTAAKSVAEYVVHVLSTTQVI